MTARPVITPLIRIDGGTQPRAAINEAVVAEYAEALRGGATFPPLIVFFDGADHWLGDGFHRFHAYRAAGTEPTLDIRSGTRRDAILFSVGANATHGLRRSNEDKRKGVATLMADPEWSQWSNVEIARRCGVSDELVRQVRLSLPTVGSEPKKEARRVVTKHGTETTMDTSRIGRAVSPTSEPAEPPAEPPARPAAPKPDKTADRIAVLEAALEDARDAAAEAGALAQDLLAQVNGEADKRLEQLRAELRATQATRDIAMRENAALKREVKALRRRLGEDK